MLDVLPMKLKVFRWTLWHCSAVQNADSVEISIWQNNFFLNVIFLWTFKTNHFTLNSYETRNSHLSFVHYFNIIEPECNYYILVLNNQSSVSIKNVILLEMNKLSWLNLTKMIEAKTNTFVWFFWTTTHHVWFLLWPSKKYF